MIVVSDTSAITSLLQIQRADLRASLYHEVVIPAVKGAVHESVILPPPPKPCPLSASERSF